MSELIALAWPIVALVGIGVIAASARFVWLQRHAIVMGQQTNHTHFVNLETTLARVGAMAEDSRRRLEKMEALPPGPRRPAPNIDAFR